MKRKKSSSRLIISGLMLLMILYLMLTSTVFAADPIDTTYGDKDIQVTGSVNGKWDVFVTVSNKITADLSPQEEIGVSENTYSERSDTVTVTNNTGAKAVISFKYKLTSEYGSATVNGKAASKTENSEEITLNNGEFFQIILKSGAASGANGKLEIWDFFATIEDTVSIWLKPPVDGSYTVTTANSTESITMTASSTETEFHYVSTAGVIVTATAENGYKFDRWENASTGTILSYTDSCTISTGISPGEALAVSFVPNGYNRAFTVGTDKYYSWEDAMDAAVNSDKPVVVLNMTSYTLPATESDAIAAGEKIPGRDEDVEHIELVTKGNVNYIKYIVPSGVTFGIPYDSSLSLADNGRNNIATSVGKAGYTLTVLDGSELVVRDGATFIVNAKRTCYGTKTQGVTTGNYGKLVMGGDMLLESGSKLYAYGYITDTNHEQHTYGNGTGSITAESDSYTEILFQIMSHRGGNATMNTVLKNSTKRIMPITNYYIGNLMVHTVIKNGASVAAKYCFYINSTYYDGLVNLIAPAGSSNSMFTTTDGSCLILDYDYSKDKLIVVVRNGTVNIESVSMSFTYTLAGMLPITVPINSSDLILPLTDNLQVYVGEPGADSTNTTNTAAVNLTNRIKMLPGATIHVMENGTLNIPSELYLYASKDYKTTWSYSVYRTTLLIQDTYKKGSAITVSDDAAIYLAGTINVNGTLLQSSESTDVKNNRIIPTSETAVLNVNSLANSGSVWELPEVDTDNFYENKAWKTIDGIFAGETEYKDFPSTGTYKVIKEKDSVYKWYSYKVTYEFEDEEKNKLTGLLADEQNSMYIVGDSTTLAASSLAGGKYVIKGYTIKDSAGNDITSTVSAAAGENDPNVNNPVSYGWENITFSGLKDDVTVTLTVAPYENRVNWTANAESSTAEDTVWTDYVMDTASFTPDVEAACVFKTDITAVSGTTEGIITDTQYITDADNKTTSTFVVSGITNDINVAVTYDSSAYKVTWNVTDWNGNTTSDYMYVSKGDKAEYSLKQTDDAWYIITSYSTPTTVTTVTKTDTTITLEGVNDTTVVDLTVAKYDYQLSVTGLTSLTDATNIPVGPYYLNKGEELNISGSDFMTGKRFAFMAMKSCTPDSLAFGLTPEMLTITAPDSGAKNITVLVELDEYDYKVVVKEGFSTLSTQYIDGNSTSYTFVGGSYVKDYTISGTATVNLVNPTLTTAASLKLTEINSDVTITVTTAKYDHILTLVDASSNPLGDPRYVSGASHTYSIANNDLHYIVDAQVISDSTVGSATLGDVGGKSITISDISGNPTVQLKLQAYKYTVAWNDKEGKTLQSDYILENQTETSYTCDNGYVARLTSVGAAAGSQHAVSTTDNKTYQVANISSNITVVLDLIPYDYAVTVDDGMLKDTWYVKNDEDVLNGGGIFYQVDTKKYISNYDLTGTATVSGSTNTVTDGWERVDVTGISSDVTLTLTVKAYDYKVTWNVTTTTGDEEFTTKKIHYVTGTTDSFEVGEAYSIASKKTTNGTVTNVGSVVTVSDLTGNATVTVEARDYLYEITWIYTQADENHEDVVVYQQVDVEADGTVKWTVPESEDGKSYVVTGATVTGGTATHTNKTITVTPEDDKVTVKIDLAEALTNYTALWGDMSYKYYKNGAFYSRVEDGETYKWKLMDSYAWTPKVGSMITYYEGEPYVVPNGSVMLVNPTNQAVKATIKVEMTYTESDWVVVPTMTLTPEKGVAVTTVNGKAVMEIILSPGDSMIVTGTMEGTPLDATTLEDVEGGSWSVEIKPID